MREPGEHGLDHAIAAALAKRERLAGRRAELGRDVVERRPMCWIDSQRFLVVREGGGMIAPCSKDDSEVGLCFDVIGLFAPKFYQNWFGEDPFEPIPEADGFEVERTMIPFGPYLAVAGWIVFFWGEKMIGAYLRISGLA